MNDAKYFGLDVHHATISATVLDSTGKLVMECVLETKGTTILQFIHGLRGSLHVTLEEGTCTAWLHDMLKPHVTEVLVCNPRKNALLKVGNKNDRIDARKMWDKPLTLKTFAVQIFAEDTRSKDLTSYFPPVPFRNHNPVMFQRVDLGGATAISPTSRP